MFARKQEIMKQLETMYALDIIEGYQVGLEYDEEMVHTGRYEITLFLPAAKRHRELSSTPPNNHHLRTPPC